MKNRLDKAGNKVRVYEPGDGIRRRYRAALDPSRAAYPRKDQVNHRIEWYLDGHLVERPLYGLYSLGNLAEYFLHHVKFGRRRQKTAIREATEFFAATRRAMQNVLDEHSLDSRVPDAAVEFLRQRVTGLINLGRVVYDMIGRGGTACECPACKGGGISRRDADLLEALLREQSANGTIPIGSALYREAT